jgi:hypothetical protein
MRGGTAMMDGVADYQTGVTIPGVRLDWWVSLGLSGRSAPPVGTGCERLRPLASRRVWVWDGTHPLGSFSPVSPVDSPVSQSIHLCLS